MEEYLPKPITKNSMEIILDQMTNSLCWINQKEGNYEIGFLVHFKYENDHIPVLITKYNTLDNYNEKTLNIFLNNKEKNIKLGDKKYKNKDYDISIIEIIEDKNDNIKYLEIDENIFKNELELNYLNESIYVIQYDNKKNISISFGLIKGMVKSKIYYSCNINSDYKYLIIFNLSNNKIIGIQENNKNYYNKGRLIRDLIKTFFKENKNEITLILYISGNKPPPDGYIFF